MEPDKWSKEFNDFIARCLVKDPAQRATAKELLEHPFIVNAKGTEALVGMVREYLEIQEQKAREKEERVRHERTCEGRERRATLLRLFVRSLPYSPPCAVAETPGQGETRRPKAPACQAAGPRLG